MDLPFVNAHMNKRVQCRNKLLMVYGLYGGFAHEQKTETYPYALYAYVHAYLLLWQKG
jgi:hypothetical protein